MYHTKKLKEYQSKRVALLLSGGVDSAVVLYMFKQAGITPHAFYIHIGPEEKESAPNCTEEEDWELVELTARNLDCPITAIDLHKDYWSKVMAYAFRQLKEGRTPNPDVLCNRLIKFGAFEEQVGRDYDYIATGHYGRILYDEDNTCWLGTAADAVKDQTDFLAQITEVQLEKLILPLGGLHKAEVRAIANQANLPSAARRDSQGICFIGRQDFDPFIKQYLGEAPGPIIDLHTGKTIGEHRGVWFHTIGQRKGLGLGGGPWFVVKKDVKTQTLYVVQGVNPEEQYSKAFRLADFHFINANPWTSEGTFPISFKIRHTQEFNSGMITFSDSGVLIESASSLQGVSPGQFGVVYDKEHQVCIGSGEIEGIEN